MTDYSGILIKMKQAKKKSKCQFGVLVEEYAYQFYKGVMYFYNGDYGAAKKNFMRAATILERQEEKS